MESKEIKQKMLNDINFSKFLKDTGDKEKDLDRAIKLYKRSIDLNIFREVGPLLKEGLILERDYKRLMRTCIYNRKHHKMVFYLGNTWHLLKSPSHCFHCLFSLSTPVQLFIEDWWDQRKTVRYFKRVMERLEKEYNW